MKVNQNESADFGNLMNESFEFVHNLSDPESLSVMEGVCKTKKRFCLIIVPAHDPFNSCSKRTLLEFAREIYIGDADDGVDSDCWNISRCESFSMPKL